MNASQLMLSPDAYNAWLLRQVIEDTTPADEAVADAHTRAGAILEMFRCMAPTDGVEAMLACHCIQLRFSARAALRDAEAPGQDAKTQKAMRASAMSISRELRVFLDKLEKMRARNAAAAEPPARAPKPASRPEVGAVRSTPEIEPPPDRQPPPPDAPPAAEPRRTPAPAAAAMPSPPPGTVAAPAPGLPPVNGAVPVIATG